MTPEERKAEQEHLRKIKEEKLKEANDIIRHLLDEDDREDSNGA